MIGGEIYVLIWLVCGVGAFLIAQNRGATNAPTWFLVGVLLGPLGILFAALSAKPSQGVAANEAVNSLRQLGELREKNLLTEAEFEAKKAALLPLVGGTPEPAKRGVYFWVVWGITGFLVLVMIALFLRL